MAGAVLARGYEMTPKYFAEAMAEIAKNGDTEAAHSQADDLLCLALEDKGFSEGVKIFREMDKWYA
jgi:hypothetical protein